MQPVASPAKRYPRNWLIWAADLLGPRRTCLRRPEVAVAAEPAGRVVDAGEGTVVDPDHDVAVGPDLVRRVGVGDQSVAIEGLDLLEGVNDLLAGQVGPSGFER